MTTQYTTILKLALPVQGELSGTWGDVVNDNITQMVEQAVAGKAVINTWTGNSHTLTTADGTTSESRCAILELTDSGTALTGAGTVVCPTNTKLYIVDNNTAQIVTVKTSGGTGVAVPVGKTMLVYCDGTNVVEGVTHANSLSLGTSTVTADKILDEDNMASDSATAIATQQSIKAYVDSQVGSFDTLAEVLAQGNTTGGTDLAVSTGDDITFADNSKAIFGAGSDLQIYHHPTDGSFIVDNGTGNLQLDATDFRVRNTAGTEAMIHANADGAVKLFYNGTATPKLETTATGIDVTGTVTADGLTVDGTGSVTQSSNAATALMSFTNANAGASSRSAISFASDTGASVVGTVSSGWTVDALNANETFVYGSNGVSLFAPASQNIRFLAGGSEKVRITSAGNVGIGTDSPAAPLDVVSSSGAVAAYIRGRSSDNIGSLYFTSNADASTEYGYIQGRSTDLRIQGFNNGLILQPTGGNVGIGTSSPNGNGILTLNTPADNSAQIVFAENDTAKWLIGHRHDGDYFRFYDLANSAERMRIDANGDIRLTGAAPNSEDNISTINFFNSSSGINLASITGKRTAGGTNYGSLIFNTTSSGTAAERMRIDASGNVGIGTSNPTAPLHVDAAGMGDIYSGLIENTTTDTDHYNVVRFMQGASGSATGFIGTGGSTTSNTTFRNTFVIGTQTSNDFVVATSDTERLRIDSLGGITAASQAGGHVVFNSNTVDADFRVAYNGGTHALYVDGATGNVGIGVVPDTWSLASHGVIDLGLYGSVNSSSTLGTTLSFNAYYNSGWKAKNTTGAMLYLQDSASHQWFTSSSVNADATITDFSGPKMKLDASGNFIVGATSAFDSSSFCVDQSGFGQFRRDGTPLLVRRDGSFGDLISFEDDGASVGGIRTGTGTLDINTASNTSFTVLQNGAAKMEIAGVNGSLYLYAQATGAGNADLRYTTSDGKVTYDTSSRLVKDEIEEIPYGLNTVMALSPKRYIRTDSDNKLEVGFIADEVVEVVPELVGMMEKRFLTMNQEDTEMVAGSVEYNKMTAVLVKAIQEQQATIEALTARIAALES